MVAEKKQEFCEAEAQKDQNAETNKTLQDEAGAQKENQNDLQKQLEELSQNYKSLNDKHLRCLAEYDNFRKRTAKEKDNIFSDGLIFAIKGVLDVFDNFERALKCETQDNEFKKGCELIFKQLQEAIKKLGVEEIQTDSQVFDPTYHNAVMHIEDEQYGQNQIVETLQKGYKLGDNVIRYAMVKVAN